METEKVTPLLLQFFFFFSLLRFLLLSSPRFSLSLFPFSLALHHHHSPISPCPAACRWPQSARAPRRRCPESRSRDLRAAPFPEPPRRRDAPPSRTRGACAWAEAGSGRSRSCLGAWLGEGRWKRVVEVEKGGRGGEREEENGRREEKRGKSEEEEEALEHRSVEFFPFFFQFFSLSRSNFLCAPSKKPTREAST